MPFMLHNTNEFLLVNTNQFAFDEACCCDECSSLPASLSFLLSGYSGMSGCINYDGTLFGNYLSVTDVNIDNSYPLSGGSGSWDYTTTGDYADVILYGNDSSCSSTGTPDTLSIITLTASCSASVLSIVITVQGNAEEQIFIGSATGPFSNPIIITTTTSPSSQVFLNNGTVTITW